MRHRTGRIWGIAILLVWTLGVGWIWVRPAVVRQNQVLATIALSLLVGVAAIAWFFWLSGAGARTRRIGWIALAALALVAASLRFSGVTGDLRPIFTWRWTRGDMSSLPTPVSATLDVGPTLADSYQFLGPRRNGVIDGVLLERDWDQHPPREIWRRAVGAGLGSFAVQGEIAVTQEQRGTDEVVVAYALATGEPVWVHADATRYDSPIAGVGPRATPAIDGSRVFSMGATGLLNALDLATGELLWSHDVVAENGAKVPGWGKSTSPLVLDGKVIVSAGGIGRSLVAYDAASGELVWSGGDDRSGYASPLLATLAGVPQILILNAASLAAHDPGSGSLLWTFPWPRAQPNVAQPLPIGDDGVIASSGYGVGAKRLRVSRTGGGELAVELVWESIRLKAKFAHFVLYEGFIYGLDDGMLVCLDPESGQKRWKRGRYGHGQLLLVEDVLLIQAEDGDLVLVRPNPEQLRQLARLPALDSRTWNIPTLAGNRLLVRNDQQAAMFELATR